MSLLTEASLIGRVGAGAMGEVWELEHNGRRYACKWPQATQQERLRIEAVTIAKLNHKNIVPIYDVGEVASCPQHLQGQVALIMPLASEGSLQRGVSYTVDQVGQILSRVLKALAYCHARSLLHLDIKPENILIHRSGRRTHLWLADFGLRQTTSTQRHLTIGGTLGYAAPEQRTGLVSPGTDLFAVGVTTWELVTGQIATLPLRIFPHDPALSRWCQWLTHPDVFKRPATAAHALAALNLKPGLLSLQRRGKRASRNASQTQAILTPMLVTSAPAPTTPPPDWAKPVVAPTWGNRQAPKPAPPNGLGILHLQNPPVIGRFATRDQLWSALKRASQNNKQWLTLAAAPGVGKKAMALWLGYQAVEQVGAAFITITENWPQRLLHQLYGHITPATPVLAAIHQGAMPLTANNTRLITKALAEELRHLHRPVVLHLTHHNPAVKELFSTAKNCPLFVVSTAKSETADITMMPLEPQYIQELLLHLLPIEDELAHKISTACGGDTKLALQLLYDLNDRNLLTLTPSSHYTNTGPLMQVSNNAWRSILTPIAPQDKAGLALLALLQPASNTTIEKIRRTTPLSEQTLQSLFKRGLIERTPNVVKLSLPQFREALLAEQGPLFKQAAELCDPSDLAQALLAAKLYLSAGDFKRCIGLLHHLTTVVLDVEAMARLDDLTAKLQQHHPLQSPPLVLLKARILYCKGKMSEMMACLSALKDANLTGPLQASHLELQGLSCLLRGQLKDAEQIAKRQLEFAKSEHLDLARPYVALARLHSFKRDFTTELDLLDLAETHAPNPHLQVGILILRSNALIGLNAKRRALEAASKAKDFALNLGSAGMIVHCYNSLGDAYCLNERFQLASEQFERAIAFCGDRLPVAAFLHSNIAYTELRRGLFQRALSRLQAIDSRLNTKVSRLEQLLSMNMLWALCELGREAEANPYITRLQATLWVNRPEEVRFVYEQLRAFPEIFRQLPQEEEPEDSSPNSTRSRSQS